MMKKKEGCSFCSDHFPYDYQLISEDPEYWLFIMNKEPQCNFHCLIVLKTTMVDRIPHISHIGHPKLPDKAVRELGRLLKWASFAIMKSDSRIERILLASLNTGEKTKHLHFHLIPKKKGEKVKRVNNPKDDGGGLFFLARKEIIIDTFEEFLDSTTCEKSKKLTDKIKSATKIQIRKNAKILRRKFAKVWKSDKN